MADRGTIGCMGESKNPIIIARAIIRIGDAARNANDYSLLGALHEIVEKLSQYGVKDADVDMDLLLEYVEAADGCDYCRAGDDQPDVDELTTIGFIDSTGRQSGWFSGFAARPFFECGIAGLL